MPEVIISLGNRTIVSWWIQVDSWNYFRTIRSNKQDHRARL